MRVRGETIGALNLFRNRASRLDQADEPVVQGMADIAAVALMQERSLRESRSAVTQLEGALTSRVVIEQAKGVLAERAQITMDAAFVRLRNYARNNNVKLSQVAQQLIDGQIDPATLTAANR